VTNISITLVLACAQMSTFEHTYCARFYGNQTAQTFISCSHI